MVADMMMSCNGLFECFRLRNARFKSANRVSVATDLSCTSSKMIVEYFCMLLSLSISLSKYPSVTNLILVSVVDVSSNLQFTHVSIRFSFSCSWRRQFIYFT